MSTNKTPNGFNESFEDKLIIIRLCSNLSLFFFFLLFGQMLPLNTNIRVAYANGKDDEQNFIQNLSLFLCTFLKEHGQLIEKRPNLRETLMEVGGQHSNTNDNIFTVFLFVCLFLFSCGPWTLMLWLTVILSILASLSVSGDCQIFFFSSCILSLLLGMGIV